MIILRAAYLEAVKRYHPDKATSERDQISRQDKFVALEDAYKKLRNHLEIEELELTQSSASDASESGPTGPKDPNSKYKAPQHRQYLSNEGIGSGTPSQRSQQYQKVRLSRAMDNLADFRVAQATTSSIASAYEDHAANSKELALRDLNLKAQIKTHQAIERLVEDLIQESMAKGEFDNLPGSGKPLPYKPEIPYVDPIQYRLNEVLIQNGFVPEWVTLEKEITAERVSLRAEIDSILSKYSFELSQSRTGPSSLSHSDVDPLVDYPPQEILARTKKLNYKIDKFNTLVPATLKQKIHFLLKQEYYKAIERVKLQSTQENLNSDKCDKSAIDSKCNFNNSSHQSSRNENQAGAGTLLDLFLGKWLK